jgi:hypothetical protein
MIGVSMYDQRMINVPEFSAIFSIDKRIDQRIENVLRTSSAREYKRGSIDGRRSLAIMSQRERL